MDEEEVIDKDDEGRVIIPEEIAAERLCFFLNWVTIEAKNPSGMQRCSKSSREWY